MNKPDPIPARLAALKTTPTPDLKKQWRDLFESEPPPFNRRYLESRRRDSGSPPPEFYRKGLRDSGDGNGATSPA